MLQYYSIGSYTINMYNLINYISAAVLFIYVFSHIREFSALLQSLDGRKGSLAKGGALLFLIYTVFSILFFFLNTQFGNWFTNGNKNYFGTLLAWFISFAIVPVIFKISPYRTLDLFSAGLPLQLMIAKIACSCWGCCWGKQMDNSFYYNHNTSRYEVPVQIVEALVAFLLFIYLIYKKKRMWNPQKEGSIFPLYLILYSISRFITEFLRSDLPNVWGKLDAYQVLSIIFMLFGVLLLCLVYKCDYRRLAGRPVRDH